MIEWMRKNDVFTRVLSLIAAVALWFFVVETEDKTQTKTVYAFPVDFTNTALLANNDLIIVEGSQSSINFEVSGATSVLKNLDLDLIRASADLSNITEPGSYNVKYELSTIVSGIQMQKLTPSVEIVVDRMISKPVPIDLTLGGKLDDGYILDSYDVLPDAITVTGPAGVLEKIVSAKTAYDISSLEGSTVTTLGYALIDAEGDEVKSNFMSVNTPSIDLSLSIRKTGDIPLVLNIENYGFITENDVEVKLLPETIKVNGNPEDIATLNRIDIGTLDLQSVFEKEEFEFELPLILPNGITADEDIKKVKVTVDTKDIEKTSIEIPAEELPESTEFTYVSDLVIEVWTTKRHAPSLEPSSVDLEVSYDPEDLQVGFNELPVRVTTQDESINIIGEYTIVVEVPEDGETNNPADPE